MMTRQIGSIDDALERARKALSDYLIMFFPGSWKDPLDKLKLVLQTTDEIDWEALKGHALVYFDEKRLPEDRVECLARIERMSDSLKEVCSIVSPAEWYRTIENIVQAANFRASKAAIQTKRVKVIDEIKKRESESSRTK
ncbi:hypothetical protein EU524_00125 [Candidatus Thorarchaeota archaeon]|jgi:hypothetical protein|nr:MAG: hypothetical protein EU524_00125 [Candidatus Thorarchaeota archaeon]